MVKAWRPEPVKKLIFNAQTGLYLTPNGQWTTDEEQAKDFPSIFQALEFCVQCNLTDAELIFKFGDGHYEASLPISEISADDAFTALTKFPYHEVSFEH